MPTPQAMHVLDPLGSGAAACPAILAWLSRNENAHDAVVVLGGRSAATAAWHWGLRRFDLLGAPSGRPELCAPALRALLRARQPVILHAWSPRALIACAVAAAGSRTPIAGAVWSAPEPGLWGVLAQRCVRARAGAIAFETHDVARSWLDDAEPGLIMGPSPLGVGLIRPDTRAQTHARWGIAPGSRVIAILAEPGNRAEARDAAFLLGIITLAGLPVTGIAQNPHGLERARRLTSRHADRWRLLADPRPVSAWIAACDAALWRPGRGPAHTPARAAACALAAGIPLVVERGEDADLPPPDTCIHVPPGHNHAAGTLLDILEGRNQPAIDSRIRAGVSWAGRRHDAEAWATGVAAVHRAARLLAAPRFSAVRSARESGRATA